MAQAANLSISVKFSQRLVYDEESKYKYKLTCTYTAVMYVGKPQSGFRSFQLSFHVYFPKSSLNTRNNCSEIPRQVEIPPEVHTCLSSKHYFLTTKLHIKRKTKWNIITGLPNINHFYHIQKMEHKNLSSKICHTSYFTSGYQREEKISDVLSWIYE